MTDPQWISDNRHDGPETVHSMDSKEHFEQTQTSHTFKEKELRDLNEGIAAMCIWTPRGAMPNGMGSQVASLRRLGFVAGHMKMSSM